MFLPGDYPDLLVGLGSPDDAAVWRLDEQRALVLTTDFFTPVVDDAYDYGAIAATNSLSDIYAMGGTPFLALNVAALPTDLPHELMTAILHGAADIARQAGVVIAGGHTVQDKEPKFGLVVAGFVDPQRILTKRGARPGDRLILTKPLGFGVVTTALKRQQARAEDVREAVSWMTRLNAAASKAGLAAGVRAATDITGYSLLGHGCELAEASQVRLRIEYDRLPFLACARSYAEAGTFPGGAADNRRFFGSRLRFDPRLDAAAQMLLFDPQTSGGLLMALPADKLAVFQAQALALEAPFWTIGEVLEGSGIEVI